MHTNLLTDARNNSPPATLLFSKLNSLNMENKSTARRKIAQIKQGRIISTWDGIREMCSVLHLDRRAVMRHLKKEEHYNSVKGFQFEYIE